MGQLERYGLYVLCLVIFLILGVAVWGGDPAMASLEDATAKKVAAAAGGDGGTDASAAVDDGGVESAEEALARLTQGFYVSESRPPVPATLSIGHSPASLDFAPAVLLGQSGQSGQSGRAGQAQAPGPQPGAQPQPTVTAARGYVVQPGDILGEIARRTLGSALRWKEIESLNPGIDPRRLKPGTTLKLPDAAAASSPLGADEYEIRPGDILEEIAKRELGSRLKWKEIVRANPGLNPVKLKPGQRIRIPR